MDEHNGNLVFVISLRYNVEFSSDQERSTQEFLRLSILSFYTYIKWEQAIDKSRPRWIRQDFSKYKMTPA